jgi:putative transposase
LRQPKTGILHHSDRGSQYCSYDYQRILGRHGFILSMSGKGNCYDNAMVETVFKTITPSALTSGQRREWRERTASRRCVLIAGAVVCQEPDKPGRAPSHLPE